MDLLADVFATIESKQLFSIGERVLLGVSGGADSTALVDIMVRFCHTRCPLILGIATLDHGLRPQAAQETEHVKALAQKHGLELFYDKVFLGEQQTALEERARKVRYQFLQYAAQKFRAYKIVVAHHADDQSETVLMHLLTGSSVQGLSGMRLKRQLHRNSNIYLIRPLLQVRKEALLAYLRQQRLKWCEDTSNTDLAFTRNRMRHIIIPFLQRHVDGAVSGLLRTAKRCQELTDYLASTVDNLLQNLHCSWCPHKPDFAEFISYLSGENFIYAVMNERWQQIPQALVPFLVKEIFEQLGVENISLRENHYRMLWQLNNAQRGMIKLPHGLQIIKDNRHTYFSKQCASALVIPQQIKPPQYVALSPVLYLASNYLRLEQPYVGPFAGDNLAAMVAAHDIEMPFTVRFYRKGDTVRLFGSPGKRKLARILGDLKIPAFVRKMVVVVTDARGNILWIPGIGIAHAYSIHNTTRHILCLQLRSTKSQVAANIFKE